MGDTVTGKSLRYCEWKAGKTLVPIIERKVTPDSIVYSDNWRGYNALDVSSFKHFVSIILSSLQRAIITSVALRIFGAKSSVTCANSTVS